MTIGGLVAIGCALTFWVHPYFIAMPAFVGLGLFNAGLTGACPMAAVLARMPWNSRRYATEMCATKTTRKQHHNRLPTRIKICDKISDAIDAFLDHHDAAKQASEHTLRAYKHELRQLHSWLLANRPDLEYVASLDGQILRGYIGDRATEVGRSSPARSFVCAHLVNSLR